MHELNDAEGAVEIRKMENTPSLAKVIYVEWLQDEVLSENQKTEITYMLGARYNNRIVAEGQHLIFTFYGLRPKLKVSKTCSS